MDNKFDVNSYYDGKILHLIFDTSEEMCASLVRFQEYYESPYKEIRNQIFTIGYFYHIYSKYNNGVNSYIHDWEGYNIPNDVLTPFLQGLFDPLTEAEQKILDLIRYRTDKYYIIGSAKNCDDSINKHELLHAYFYLNQEYQKQVMKTVIKDKKLYKELLAKIKSIGYTYLSKEQVCLLNSPYLPYLFWL